MRAGPRLIALIALSLGACAAPSLERAERHYADFADAAGALDTIDSGVVQDVASRDRADWTRQYDASRVALERVLARNPAISSPEDERSLAAMRAYLDYRAPLTSADTPTCSQAPRTNLTPSELSAALYECFDSVALGLSFEGEDYDRLSIFGILEEESSPERRRAAFFAMSPLWRALNGDNEPSSPYRRLIAAQAPDMRRAIAESERSLGLAEGEGESWLIAALEAWAQGNDSELTAPWDFDFAHGAAARGLNQCAGDADSARVANARFFADLGAPIASLNVIEDVGLREGMSPVDFADFVNVGRTENGAWRPALSRVSVLLGDGGLGASAELAHEYGHVAHMAAMRTRAPLLWPDDTTTLVEAIADVTAWSIYTPAWQNKYLGCAASETDNLRARLAPMMLDIAWGLFELRLARDPSQDPNALWTQITHDYLAIAPHPELSWWAVRGQLVESPGYMINYALGAFVTADLRATIEQHIGAFDAGNPRWYAETSHGLFQYGGAPAPRDLLQSYLGRPVVPNALLDDLRARGNFAN
ncbi:MAG: hypothetical protein NW206_17275 [Hyphomonadaceae bacterium]|nr:hypothetical protein [Hyphomonadaceae bacterium]